VVGPLTVDDIGTYQTMYTDLNGCIATSAVMEITGQASENLWVYPNPNHGKFNVRYFNNDNEVLSLNIYNASGRKVFQKSFTTSTAYSLIEVDLGSTHGNGIFIVELINAAGKRVGVKRIIVQHP